MKKGATRKTTQLHKGYLTKKGETIDIIEYHQALGHLCATAHAEVNV